MAETAADGTLIAETVKNTSANGLSITTQTDHTGSGTFDTTVTDNTVNNADRQHHRDHHHHQRQRHAAEGKQIVNTSADRSTVTTTTINGDGQTVQVDTAVTAPTGVTTDTLANYNPDGSLRQRDRNHHERRTACPSPCRPTMPGSGTFDNDGHATTRCSMPMAAARRR